MEQKKPSQIERCREAARQVGRDEDEKAFDDKLEGIARQEPRRPNPSDGSHEQTHSIGEAKAFALAQIAYCDQMETTYPNARMASLRRIAAEYLIEIERDPLDWQRLRSLDL